MTESGIRLYTPRDAAALIDPSGDIITANALRRIASRGDIESRKILGKIMFRIEDIKNYIEASKCQRKPSPRALSSVKNQGDPLYMSSAGPKMAVQSSVARAQMTANKLKSRSRAGSSSDQQNTPSAQANPMSA